MKVYIFSIFYVVALVSNVAASIRQSSSRMERGAVVNLMRQCGTNEAYEAYEASKALGEFDIKNGTSDDLERLLVDAIKKTKASLERLDEIRTKWPGNVSQLKPLSNRKKDIIRTLTNSYDRIKERLRDLDMKAINGDLSALGFVDFQIDKQKHTDLDFNASNEKEREVSRPLKNETQLDYNS